MMSMSLLIFFIGPLSGNLSDRIGSRGLAFFGMFINSVGLVFLSRLDASSENLDVAWRLAMCGLGSGMFQSPINSALMGSVQVKFRGVASSIAAVMRNTGMAFGIAVAGAIVYNLAPFTTGGHAGIFTGDKLETFINSLHWAFLAGALLALLSAFTALFAKVDVKQ